MWGMLMAAMLVAATLVIAEFGPPATAAGLVGTGAPGTEVDWLESRGDRLLRPSAAPAGIWDKTEGAIPVIKNSPAVLSGSPRQTEPNLLTVTPVMFADPQLEAVIREILGKPYEPITNADMAGVSVISAENKGISSLQGLASAVNLKKLELGSNQISELGPLAGLRQIEHLSLWKNRISSLAPLAGLTELQYLHIGFNQVTDLGPLSGLTKLQSLRAWKNLISTLTPLSGLSSLQYLDLDDNQISSLAPLAGLSSLRYLYLGDNQIVELAPLSGLNQLLYLYLGDNLVQDIGPLAGLTSLQKLSLWKNQIAEIAALTDLGNLLIVDLENNRVRNLTALAKLSGLQELYLGNNQFGEIGALANLVNLNRLYLSDNRIEQSVALIYLTNLRQLRLDGNALTEIGPLLQNSDGGGLGAGDELTLYGNYLDIKPGSPVMAQILTLQDRGVSVQYEPQRQSTRKPTVQTYSATSVNADSALLRGGVSDCGGAACDQRKFQFRQQGGSFWLDAGGEGGDLAPGMYIFSLVGLNPNTCYEYKAMSRNSFGWSEGSVLTFTTPAGGGGSPSVQIAVNRSSAPVGENIQVTINCSNIDNPEYQLWVKNPQSGGWDSLGGYSPTNAFAFSRVVAGNYQAVANVKSRSNAYSQALVSDPVYLIFDKPRAVSGLVVAGPSGVFPEGFDATFTAHAVDPEGLPLYQFWLHDAGGWRAIQDYSAVNSCTFERLQPGSYTVAIFALDQQDRAIGNWAAAYYQVFILNVGSSVMLTAPAAAVVGETIMATAQSGHINLPEYQFWHRRPDGIWQQSGDFSSSPNYSFTVDMAGSYTLVVYGKDHYAPGNDQFAVAASRELLVSKST